MNLVNYGFHLFKEYDILTLSDAESVRLYLTAGMIIIISAPFFRGFSQKQEERQR
jgi:hypothetical protein